MSNNNFLSISISSGNDKMGKIPSVSLPPIKTCAARALNTCAKKCYACKICRYSKEAKNAYQRNLDTLLNSPAVFWEDVSRALKVNRFFRFNVSGDIPNYDYFKNLVKVVSNNSHCICLIFTKQWEIVNKYIRYNKSLPDNLKVVFSGWVGLDIINPYNLPEAHVIFKNGETSASDGAKYCSGNCFDCALNNCGCWTLQKGEQVLFREH